MNWPTPILGPERQPEMSWTAHPMPTLTLGVKGQSEITLGSEGQSGITLGPKGHPEINLGPEGQPKINFGPEGQHEISRGRKPPEQRATRHAPEGRKRCHLL